MRRQGRMICMTLVALMAVFAMADTDVANSAGKGFRIIRGEGIGLCGRSWCRPVPRNG